MVRQQIVHKYDGFSLVRNFKAPNEVNIAVDVIVHYFSTPITSKAINTVRIMQKFTAISSLAS